MPSESDIRWIGSAEIRETEGALKPSAYVARAYLHLKEHGSTPPWARKTRGGRWEFREDYIRADAEENCRTIGVSEAARALGATRRAVQTWVDEGLLASEADARDPGQPRRINREAFLRTLPALRERLLRAPTHRQAAATATTEAPDGRDIPKGPPDEALRIKTELERRLHAETKRRARLARERQEAERRLAELARAEQRAAEREKRIAASLTERLAAAKRDVREADRRRGAAAKRAERKAAQEREAASRERRLGEAVAAQLASWRARLESRRPTPADAVAGPPVTADVPLDERRRSAEAVTERLRRARETHAREARMQAEATAIAERIAADVAQGALGRYDAAILFNDITAGREIDDDVRVAVMRRFFSK